jgi:hypothetical protein
VNQRLQLAELDAPIFIHRIAHGDGRSGDRWL